MVKSAAKKVAWVGRTASMVFGLALVLALMFGAASVAFAGTGVNGVFNLGATNTVNAITTLVSGGAGVGPAGPMLRIDNNSTNAAATALELLVEPGKPPMKVNSGTAKVANLDADKLDGKSAEQLSRVALMNTNATTTIPINSETTYGSPLSITAPAAGFVRVNGNVTVLNSGCTCDFTARVRHINTGYTNIPAQGDVHSSQFNNVSLDGVYPVSAGVNTFDIRLTRSGYAGTLSGWYGTLTAEYTPYGSTGSGTLSSSSATTTMSAAQEGAITKELPAER